MLFKPDGQPVPEREPVRKKQGWSRLLFLNLTALFAAALGFTLWVESLTDWVPAISGMLILEVGGVMAGCYLLLLLGKNYPQKIVRTAGRFLKTKLATVIIAILLAGLGIFTASARTIEVQFGASQDRTATLKFGDTEEPLALNSGRQRVVRFAWPTLSVHSELSLPCKQAVSGLVHPFSAWRVDLSRAEDSPRLIVKGSESFNSIFGNGVIPPLDLRLSVPTEVAEVLVPQYRGRPLLLGNCACNGEPASQCIHTDKVPLANATPKGTFVCVNTQGCTFYGSRNRQIKYRNGQSFPAELNRLHGSPTSVETWEITMELP
jgi:hypothetical protein